MEAYRDQYATIFNGGNKVNLVAISVDPDTMQAAWAREKNFPWIFGTDPDGAVGKLYQSYDTTRKVDVRNVIVIGPDGRIAHEMRSFKVLVPEQYTQLDSAIDRASLKVTKDR